MKVLLYIDNLGAGGAQRQLTGLASMLANDGNEVMVLTYHDWPFYKSSLTDNTQYLCIEDKGNPVKRLWNFRKILKSFNPSVVISYLRSPGIIASSAKFFGFFKGKLIVSERSLSTKTSWETNKVFFFYRFADKIVANSYAQHAFIQNHYPLIANKCITIPNFVDLDKFSPNAIATRSHSNVIIVVASIRDLKNPKRLILAAKELKNKGFIFTIKWFGLDSKEEPYYQECNSIIVENGLDDQFLFLNKTRDIASEYKKADFFCLPSLFEGTSNALCEAMASGLPVICGDISDNAQYVKDGETGYLFDPNDINSIVDAISKVLSLSDEDYIYFSNNSRKVAIDSWSNKLFFSHYKSIIEE